MHYSVELTRAAFRAFRKLPVETSTIYERAIDSLAENPSLSRDEVKKLSGQSEDFYRLKIRRHHRVIFKIDEENHAVLVVVIGHRDKVYKTFHRYCRRCC